MFDAFMSAANSSESNPLGCSGDGKYAFSVQAGTLMQRWAENLSSVISTNSVAATYSFSTTSKPAVSFTGKYVLCASTTTGIVNVSSNYGANFTSITIPGASTPLSWAISSSGANMLCIDAVLKVFCSSDYGVTWAMSPIVSPDPCNGGIKFLADEITVVGVSKDTATLYKFS